MCKADALSCLQKMDFWWLLTHEIGAFSNMAIRWRDYQVKGLYDELVKSPGRLRDSSRKLCKYLSTLKDQDILDRKAASELAIHVMGS